MEEKIYSGIKDEPITTFDADTLGLEGHARVLSNFIASCDTPMTIAIQGDWGSGKTSMMELIKHHLCDAPPISSEEPTEKKGIISPIWFNTWQYSQFDLHNSLSLSLLSSFLDQVSEVAKKNNKVESVKNNIKQLGLMALKVGVKNTTGIDTDEIIGQQETDPAKVLQSLRGEIQKAVDSVIRDSSNNIDRFVVFIDDIDRLVPLKAVELLESMKLFLDIPNCVFVLACDYKIVVQGLREKFNVGEGEINGRSFFDKIIQVPYNIPTHLYDINRYIKELLNTISVKPTERELTKYRNLLQSSVGLNPRSYKRIFNSFLLLRMINNESQELASPQIDNTIEANEEDLIRFATLCLQTSYEDEFRAMLNLGNALNGNWFSSIKDPEGLNNFYDAVHQLSVKKSISDHRKKAFSKFIAIFFDAIQLGSDGDDSLLSDREAQVLQSIMNSSGILGVSENDQGGAIHTKDEYALQLLDAINSSLREKKLPALLYPDDYEIDWKTNHPGTWIFLKIETLRMRKNIKVKIGLFNEAPRKNNFKTVREKINHLSDPECYSEWNWETQEDSVWYYKTLPISPKSMDQSAEELSALMIMMKQMARKIGIEAITKEETE